MMIQDLISVDPDLSCPFACYVMSWVWRLTASPTSGLRGCHSLGGRARWQPSTQQWFGILAIVAWRTTLFKNNGKAHCPSEGTAESQRPSKIWVGMSARTGDPRKTLVPKTIMAESTNEVTLGDAGRNQISVSGVSGLAPSQVWGAGSGHCGKSSKHLRNFRVGTLNVNTLKGRVCEVVETLSRRKVDLCCVQETRYRGGHCRIITGKDSRYKLFWSGNNKGTAGVGVFVAEKWIEKVFEVKRVSDRIILVKIIVGQRVLCLLSVYAPQCGLSDSVKDLFYDQLRAVTAMFPASEFLIPCGDWNGHVGSTGSGYT